MSILGIVFSSIPALFRNRSRLTLENLALRQQIAVTPTWAWFPLRRLFDRTPTYRTCRRRCHSSARPLNGAAGLRVQSDGVRSASMNFLRFACFWPIYSPLAHVFRRRRGPRTLEIQSPR